MLQQAVHGFGEGVAAVGRFAFSTADVGEAARLMAMVCVSHG